MKYSDMTKAELLKLIHIERQKDGSAFNHWHIKGFGVIFTEDDPEKMTAAELRDYLEINTKLGQVCKVYAEAVYQEGREDSPAAWTIYKAATEMVIEQRDAKSLARNQRKSAGNSSAALRQQQTEKLHGMWSDIAKLLRRHNPDIPIPEIADRIIEYIEENDSEFDFKPQRSKGTIENYLRVNL